VWWVHYPAGGYRRPVEARILKALGVKAGVPDLLLVRNGQLFGLELKAPGGRLNEAQDLTIPAMRAAGALVEVAIGLDAALDQLQRWGLLGRSGSVPGGSTPAQRKEANEISVASISAKATAGLHLKPLEFVSGLFREGAP
jgi:hypothetical protein